MYIRVRTADEVGNVRQTPFDEMWAKSEIFQDLRHQSAKELAGAAWL